LRCVVPVRLDRDDRRSRHLRHGGHLRPGHIRYAGYRHGGLAGDGLTDERAVGILNDTIFRHLARSCAAGSYVRPDTTGKLTGRW
jgi:hypothetical protein